MPSDIVKWFNELEALYQIIVVIGGLLTTIGIWEFSKIIFKKYGEKFFDNVQNSKTLKSNKSRYKDILKKEVEKLEFIIPGLGEKRVTLSEETFVHLSLSTSLKSEEHIHPGDLERFEKDKNDIEPLDIFKELFTDNDKRILLLVGDPGSGKTTLVKYFIQVILSKKGYKKLNINKPIFPFILYLRNLELEDGDLYLNLEKWTDERQNKIEADFFRKLLTKRDGNNECYVFLDGIDEAGDKDKRKKVCRFIDNLVTGLPENVKFIVSTRYTGISNQENIYLTCPHYRADLKDFNKKQKTEFLKKWLREVSGDETGETNIDKQVQAIIEYIYLPENKDIKEITGIPIMINLLALIWYKFKNKPANRSKIFKYALDYLMEFRDDQKDIQPLVDHESARKIIQPISLDMQKEVIDEIETDKFKNTTLEQISANNLKTLSNEEINVAEFCENMVNRASIISKQGDHYFVFKHKSFREYFAGLEIEHVRTTDEMNCLINNLENPWWLETTKHFFENISGIKIFNLFFSSFFDNKISEHYTITISALIVELVKLAPFKNEKIFEDILNNNKSTPKYMYALDCLLEIKKDDPDYLNSLTAKVNSLSPKLAKHINAKVSIYKEIKTTIKPEITQFEKIDVFFNDQEYIRLKGGQIDYSVTNKVESIPDLYFGKYPVTNKSYRRFIYYLLDKELKLAETLPVGIYFTKLNEFARTIEGFAEYLGSNEQEWLTKLVSKYDEDRKFNGDRQPVIGVSWYAAKAYCLWLSLFEAAEEKDGLDKSLQEIAKLYRLPKDIEWERAAKGIKNDISYPRFFPWGNDKPTPERANYNINVVNTTPVDRYPDGSTPEGIMDMSGNVWEWIEDKYDEHSSFRVLRGGSWAVSSVNLSAAVRDGGVPMYRNFDVGFRVIRPSH